MRYYERLPKLQHSYDVESKLFCNIFSSTHLKDACNCEIIKYHREIHDSSERLTEGISQFSALD